MEINPYSLLETEIKDSVLMGLSNPKNYQIDEDVELPSGINCIANIYELKKVSSLVFPDTIRRIVYHGVRYGRHGGYAGMTEYKNSPVFSRCDFSQITVYDSLEVFEGCFLNSLSDHGFIDSSAYVDNRKICHFLKKINQLDEKDRFINTVFDNCPNFRKLIIRHAENSNGMIQPALFKGVHELKEVEIQDGVKIIGDDAFAYCLNLEKITIPPSVTGIRYNAFHYDTKLEIYGCSGSYAEQYAKLFGYPFHVIPKDSCETKFN